MVALGRLRALSLSPERRSEIARAAAYGRWNSARAARRLPEAIRALKAVHRITAPDVRLAALEAWMRDWYMVWASAQIISGRTISLSRWELLEDHHGT